MPTSEYEIWKKKRWLVVDIKTGKKLAYDITYIWVQCGRMIIKFKIQFGQFKSHVVFFGKDNGSLVI